MKLIAIDLDGTLLTSQVKPSDEGIAEIAKILKSGEHKVTICTGRASYDVRNLVGLDGLPMISFNGASVIDEKGRLLNQTPIERKIAEEAVQYLHELDVYFEIFCPEAIYSPSRGEDKLRAEMDVLLSGNPDIDRELLWKSALVQFVQFGIQQVDHPQQVMQTGSPVYKLLVFTYNEGKLKAIQEQFADHPFVHTTSSADHTLEIISASTDKGQALKFLAAHYGIPLEDTVVIGDSYNDISMFKIAGTRIAMGNAVNEVKELSSAVTRSNNENGVAYALRHLL
ncbi:MULTISPECIES: Cof-type HAD-IIB family hydrolase [Paenibacillus]|uniref:Cof-type HAD-IIB family hydrolase n=1 Tax=Paenibacillus TaxID=44249 RepID=UPI002FE29406